jgi:hypothetical protein
VLPSSYYEENVTYSPEEQLPWLHEQYLTTLEDWEQNPNVVRRLETGMIAAVMMSLIEGRPCTASDAKMPWPQPDDIDPTLRRNAAWLTDGEYRALVRVLRPDWRPAIRYKLDR